MASSNGQPLSSESLPEQLEEIRKIENAEKRARVLTELATELFPSRSEVFHTTLDAAKQINYEDQRAEALATLALQLPSSHLDLLQQTLETALLIGNEEHQARVLEALASQLPPSYPELLRQAIDAAQKLPADAYRHHRANVLTALVRQLPSCEPTLLQQVLDAAEPIADDGCRARFLVALSPLLSVSQPKLLQKALEIAGLIKNEWFQSKALTAIVPKLPASPPELLQQVLETTRSMKDKTYQVKIFIALATLSNFNPLTFLQEVLDEVRQTDSETESKDDKAEALVTLVPYFSDSKQKEVLQYTLEALRQSKSKQVRIFAALAPQFSSHLELLPEALDIALQITSPDTRTEALLALASQLSEPEHSKVLQQAIDAASKISTGWILERLLANLVAQLSSSQPELLHQQVLNLVRLELDRGLYLAEAFTALVPLLPPFNPQLLQQALDIVRLIENRWEQAKAFEILAPRISSSQSDLLQQALTIARMIKDGATQVKALAALISQFPDSQSVAIRQEAIEVARRIDGNLQYQAFASLLPASQQAEILQEALEVLQLIDSEQVIARALGDLAPQLSNSALKLLEQALEVAYSMREEVYRTHAIATLVPLFPASHRPDVLRNALKAAHQLEDTKYRTKLLSSLASLCPDSQRFKVIQEALNAIRLIEDNYQKVKAFSELIPQLLDAHRPDVLKEALDAIQLLEYRSRCRELANLALQLSFSQPKLVQQALNIITQSVEDEFACSRALEALAPQLSTELLQQALNAALQIKEYETYRADALRAVIRRLPPFRTDLLQQALDAALEFKKEEYKAKVLTALARQLPPSMEEAHQRVLDAARSMEYLLFKAEVLAALAPQLPPDSDFQQRILEEALRATLDLGDSDAANVALTAIVPQFPLDSRIDLYQEVCQKVLDTVQPNNTNSAEANGLAMLVPYLPERQLPSFIEAALLLNEESCVGVLKNLAIHAPEELAAVFPSHRLSIALKTIESFDRDDHKTRFLSALATRLSTGLFSNALRLIKDKVIEDDLYRAEALSNLAPYLPADQFSEALDLVEKGIIDVSCQAEAFSSLVSYLPIDRIEQLPEVLISEVLRIAQNFQEQWKFRVLVVVALRLVKLLDEQFLPASESIKKTERHERQASNSDFITSQTTPISPEALQEELKLIQRVAGLSPKKSSDTAELQKKLKAGVWAESSVQIATLITDLAPQLHQAHPDLLQQALELANGIKDGRYRIQALAAIAPQFPPQQALELANMIGDERYRTQALATIAPQLPPSHPKLLQQALEAAQKIENREYRKSITLGLIHALPAALTQQMLKMLGGETDENCERYRAEALRILVPQLSEFQLQDVIEIIKTLHDEGYKAQALKALVLRVSKDQEKLDESLQKIEKMLQDEVDNAQPMIALVVKLSEIQKKTDESLPVLKTRLFDYQEKLYEIWKMVNDFKQDLFKIKIWSAVTTKLPEAKDLATKIHTKFNYLRVEALVEVASHSTSSQDQIDALRAIQALDYPYIQAEYLKRMASHLANRQSFSDTQRLEAKLTAQAIQEEYYRVKALIALAHHIPELRQEARAVAENIGNSVQRIELLSTLAVEVPDILPDLVKTAEENINAPLDRKYVLAALKPHLPARIVREIDRECRAGKRISEELWNRALKQLARGYRDALKAGGLLNDEAQDTDLLNLKDEINSLADLLLLRDLEPPMVVGILGGWGGGKSYIIHLMQAHMVDIRSRGGVNEEEAWNLNPSNDRLSPYVGHIYQIKFDAWSFAKSNLWASLMQTLFFELNRQITLEQQLRRFFKAKNINPYEENSNYAKVWQVLYKTSEEDRKYFLENVLKLQDLKELEKDTLDRVDKLLWGKYGDTKVEDIQELYVQESNLEAAKEHLTEAESSLASVTNAISNQEQKLQQELEKQHDQLVKQRLEQDSQPKDDKNPVRRRIEELLESESFNSTIGITMMLLRRRLGVPAADALKTEIATQLVKQNVDIKDIGNFSLAIKKTINDILEEGVITADGKQFSFSLSTFKKWAWKNRTLIAAFILLSILSILLPITLSLQEEIQKEIIPKIAAFIAPLCPALAILQKLFSSGQKWYDQAKQAVVDYGETVEKASQEKAQKLKEEADKQLVEQLQQELEHNDAIQSLKADIKKQHSEAEHLRQEIQNQQLKVAKFQQKIEEAKQSLPENIYVSLADFVGDRVKDGSYDQHLGLMHQVKDDLMNLSRRLLAPPITSEEFKHKIEDLKAVFPRGPARVIVYIDDLDRCPPERVVEVLEAVQLLVKTPLFIAVLAIDERYITRALEKHYTGVLSRRGRPSGTDYLEKIVQIPYRVRPISKSALESYIRAQVVIQDTATGGTKFSEVTRDEFNLLLKCCHQVDLSPRTLKRLTNIYKLFKIVSRTRGTKPNHKVQQAILALLVLSGRYSELIRGVFATIESCYEENRELHQPLRQFFSQFFKDYRLPADDSYLKRELDKFKHDALETNLIPIDLTLEDVSHDTFNLVRSFSFVGDIGYAPEDFKAAGLLKPNG